MKLCIEQMEIQWSEGEGEVAVFSAKRWDRRNRADLIESANPCHDAQMVGSYRGLNPLHLTVPASKSEDYTTDHCIGKSCVLFSFIFEAF